MAFTNVTQYCWLCGAENVPMKWDYSLYKHYRTVPYGSDDDEWGTCTGEAPNASFNRMLRNAGLAVTDSVGGRLKTDFQVTREFSASCRQELMAEREERLARVQEQTGRLFA